MSNPGEADATPIASARQLAEHIAAGCKPREAWRIGTEHEKFGFRRPVRDGELGASGPGMSGSGMSGPGASKPGVAYEPPGYAPDGIRAMLDGIAARGWTPISDAGAVIGLSRGGASVSLEPAGQFELSGAPLATLHETRAELDSHFEDVRAVAGPMGLGFAPLGFRPTGTREAMPWMPKSRYAIMRRYMQRTGTRGLDMMLRTCTVQVNLDYGSEADMVRKLRVGLLLQPVATALFANSPFIEGRPNGFLSARADVWLDTDADRTGIPAAVFEAGFGFERYVEWLLDVPMYFVMRQGAYVDLAGRSFRDFMAGRLAGEVPGGEAPGVATVGDFADHMTTAFTEVRLKRFLEMRGADAGTPEMMLAQSALWVGLLYDEAALEAAVSLVGQRPWRDFAALRGQVPRQGLGAAWGRGTLRDVARDVVAIARDGLRARGFGEEALLAPLHAIVAGGPTQAEHWLARYHGAWGGDVRRVFDEAEV